MEHGLKQFLGKEVSWCRICVKRNACKVKEEVSMEQIMAGRYPFKYLDVTVKCRGYIKDCSMPSAPGDYLDSIFKL